MKSSLSVFCLFFLIYNASHKVFGQTDEDTTRTEILGVEKLKYKQQPGLAMAASKIFFSDKRYSISGFEHSD